MVSYEIIGNKNKAIAIIESCGKSKMDKERADEILNKLKNVKSILLKLSKRRGRLRKREYKLLAGDKDTEVIHKEYGYLIKLNPQETYFSPRELTERQRIASQVKKNEKILVMFSGTAPFIISIKKKQPDTKICGIELNKKAHEYALENIKLNKLKNVNLINGDVRKIVPNLKEKFDRIIMPLPKSSNKFIDLAFKKIKKNGIIHYYSWGKKEEYKKIKELINKEAKKSHKKIKIINIKKVLPYAPSIYKIAIDIKCY